MLTIKWRDPRGKEWDLTTGAQGVKLDMNNSDFMGDFSYVYDSSGDYLQGVKYGRISPNLSVQIDPNLTGSDWYKKHIEWWNLAQSTTKTGRLTIRRPDGIIVYIDARLAKVPGTKFPYDPGMKFAEPPVEPWMLTSDFTHWLDVGEHWWQMFEGSPYSHTAKAIVSGDELDLSKTLTSTEIELLKAAPMYPRYDIYGVKSDASTLEFGPTSAKMKITTEGKGVSNTIRITTDPLRRKIATDDDRPRWNWVSGPLAPIAEDFRVILPRSLSSSLILNLPRPYATPF